MKRSLAIRLVSGLLLSALVTACTPAAAPTPTALPATDVPTATLLPTSTPPPSTATPVPPTTTATEAPPTATETAVPPTATATPVPDPIAIHDDQLAGDGCPVVELHPEVWSPMFAAFKGGADPFYHFHTVGEDFFFNVELYTVYGASWTGQLGTFETNCTTHGICIYLVPLPGQRYLASQGEIEIVTLAQTEGTLALPVELILRDVTLEPVPGSGSIGCYHVEQVWIVIEEA